MRSEAAIANEDFGERISIEEFPDRTLIKVPARRFYLLTAFSGLAIIGFSIVIIMFLSDIFMNLLGMVTDDLFVADENERRFETIFFMALFVGATSLAMVWSARIFLWTGFGHEVLEVRRQDLVHRICVPLFSRTQAYASGDMAGLKWLPAITHSLPMHPWSMSDHSYAGWLNPWSAANDAIAFERKSGIVRMGFGVGKAEADIIIAAMRRRMALQESAR